VVVVILQNKVPDEMGLARPLPGVAPCGVRDWLRVDEAYGAQMESRLALLQHKRAAVVWLDPMAMPAALELLDAVLDLLPDLGFVVKGDQVTCPDGRVVAVSRGDPMGCMGALVQEDLVLMEKRGTEHVLTGAVLCFPASWLLAEKVGRPLTAIHDPVEEYDADLAARVQRLFDGVKVGRPLWRMNQLWYADAELHQPRSATTPRAIEDGPDGAAYYRSERQCIVRLPQTQAVLFTIHTYVLNAAEVRLG
jgi:hypothetical protein